MTQRSLKLFPPSKHSTLQQAADLIHDWSRENHLQLNPIKCKEIRTCFKRTPPFFSQVAIEGVEFELVSSAKVLGVVISSDLKWSAHIDSITTKAAKRLYLLGQLKRAGIAHSVLVRQDKTRQDLFYSAQFYRTFRLKLQRQLNTVQLRNKRKKKKCDNKLGSELGSSK